MSKTPDNPALKALLRRTSGGLVAQADAHAAVLRAKREAALATERAVKLLVARMDEGDMAAATQILDRGGVPKSTHTTADVVTESRPLAEMSDEEIMADWRAQQAAIPPAPGDHN